MFVYAASRFVFNMIRAGRPVNGTPQENGGQQRHQGENGTKEKIKPVNQCVLQSDFYDVPIFSHAHKAAQDASLQQR